MANGRPKMAVLVLMIRGLDESFYGV